MSIEDQAIKAFLKGLYVEKGIDAQLHQNDKSRMVIKPRKYPPIGAVKHDQGKLDFSLLPLDFVACLVPVFAHGEKTYGFENWRKPFDNVERRAVAAMKRHLMECERAPLAINESDSGVYHLAQVAWNALWLLYQVQIESEGVKSEGVGNGA